MSDIDCMRSCTALRQNIYYNNKLISKNVNMKSIITPVVQKESKPVDNFEDFSADESIILAIRNDPKFINIIMNCRKQKSPNAYIFVESEYRYITCIIKNPDGFPMIIIHLPINKKYAYARNASNCYEFPLLDIINKEIKFNKSYSYTIMFKSVDSEIQFIYDIYNGTAEPNRITIDNINVNSMSTIDDMFKNISICAATMNPTLINTINPAISNLNTFNNMNIILLAEVNVNNVIAFNSKQHAKTKNYFKVTPNTLSYVSETVKKHHDTYLCSVNDSIYWNFIHNETYMCEMQPFESLFKINYNKSVSPSDKIYYVFTSFMNNYMFIKIITSLEINSSTNIETFMKTFSHEYQIIECYACVKVDE